MENDVRSRGTRDPSAGSTDAREPTDVQGPLTDAEPAERELPKDLIFGLLSVTRRRRVLAYLANRGGEATLSELAEHVASLENEKSVAALTSAERKRVYVCFYQSHLPKLADAGVIDYDQARGTVRLRREARQLYAYLSVSPGDEDEQADGIRAVVSDSLDVVRQKLRA